MTRPRRTPTGPEPHRRTTTPLVPDLRSGEKDPAERGEPHDLPFPDRWPPGRPAYAIVVDQLRGWRPGTGLSLAEALDTGRARPRQPEPDREAEP